MTPECDDEPRRQYEDLKPYIFDLSSKNNKYLDSLVLTSATIASFSLLTLQISPERLYVNAHLLILGFVILISNTLWGLMVIRWAINSEERPIKILSKVIQHQGLTRDEEEGHEKMLNHKYDVNSKLYGLGIYSNVFFLFLGLLSITLSFFIKSF